MKDMASYSVNPRVVAQARRLIDARQYVPEGVGTFNQTQATKTRSGTRNSWDDYAAWQLGPTEGASDDTKARYAFCLWRPPAAPIESAPWPRLCAQSLGTQAADRAFELRHPCADLLEVGLEEHNEEHVRSGYHRRRPLSRHQDRDLAERVTGPESVRYFAIVASGHRPSLAPRSR